MAERVLKIENSTDIKLSSSAETLRKLICKAQRDKKEDPSSRGGNSTKKILSFKNGR
jgi:hypothetical protein